MKITIGGGDVNSATLYVGAACGAATVARIALAGTVGEVDADAEGGAAGGVGAAVVDVDVGFY